ncbi:unnamed protein product [Ostreobium quekettii]|uniref:Ribosomal protein L17 n=1 Tax=Ostreobium quekettii TaxID=121088 RepID=A0A8S1IN74_9CHLO|nr:unnamed protein product [Ostreobium quekettii]|eukprot:evm.model.scf_1392.1 EVM.evm.TU.scf_1392.1   scf_1392:6229-7602(+)
MKHGLGYRKLSRKTSHRWAMLRTLVTQLIKHERIQTTLPKAKELRRLADKMVTLGKQGTLHAQRQASAVIREDVAKRKLFTEFAERYRFREGGYTRIMRSERRINDAAQMAFIEYVDREGELRPARPTKHSFPTFASQAVA